MTFQIEPRGDNESLEAWSRRVSGAFVGRRQAEELRAEGGVRGMQSLAQKLGHLHDVSFTEECGRNPGHPCPTCGQPETCDTGRLALGVTRLVFLIEEAQRQVDAERRG